MKKSENTTDKLYQIRMESSDGKSWLTLAPEYGGMLTSLGLRGEEMFYIDKSTFAPEARFYRGGIPVLFPICSGLKDKKYVWDGKEYEMQFHGVVWNMTWDVVDHPESDDSITMRVQSTEETLKVYPFEFELIFTYQLEGDRLMLTQEYRNLSDQDMPIYAGFHPFLITKSKQIAYDTDATTYLNYRDRQEKPYDGMIDIDEEATSLIFLDAKTPRIGVPVPEYNRNIVLEYGPEFKYVVLHSFKDKDCICVEPWMALPDEMNRKQELLYIRKDKPFKSFLSIKSEPL